MTVNIHDEKELNGFVRCSLSLSLSYTHTLSNDVIVVVMIMMVFVYVMMDLLGRQFGAFVPLMIDVFGLLLSGGGGCGGGGGRGRVLRLLQFATAGHGGGPVVLARVTRRILDPVVLLGRYIVTVQLVLLASDVLEVFVLSVVLLLELLLEMVVVLVRRHVRHRFEVVRAPRHLGRLGPGLATLRPWSVINDLRRLFGFPLILKTQVFRQTPLHHFDQLFSPIPLCAQLGTSVVRQPGALDTVVNRRIARLFQQSRVVHAPVVFGSVRLATVSVRLGLALAAALVATVRRTRRRAVHDHRHRLSDVERHFDSSLAPRRELQRRTVHGLEYFRSQSFDIVFGDFSMTVSVGEGVLKLVFDGYSVQRYAAIVYVVM